MSRIISLISADGNEQEFQIAVKDNVLCVLSGKQWVPVHQISEIENKRRILKAIIGKDGIKQLKEKLKEVS